MTARGELQAAVQVVTNKLIAEGRLIEAGFAAYLLVVWGDTTQMPDEQLLALRKCYFSGCQHVWGAINTMLDPGDDPSDEDLKRMDMINDELNAWHAEMVRDHVKTEGSA